MSDGIDLENILKTGFFTTSRARHSSSPSSKTPVSSSSPFIPRSFPRLARRRPSYPPPPFAEDEIVSLRKELGSFVIPVFDEEPQSRGEIDQQPIILEVFEYNPERRFVVLPGSSGIYDSEAEDKAARKRAHRRAKSTRLNRPPPSTTTAPAPAPAPASDATASGDDDDDVRRDQEPGSGYTHHFGPHERRPQDLGRRRSRQDLPRIETDLEDYETPAQHHHRSKSDAGDARPNFSPSQHHHHHHQHPHHHHPHHHPHQTHHHHHVSNDDFLSPNVSKRSPSRREKFRPDHDRSSSRDQRDDRQWDGRRWRSLTPSIDERSTSRCAASHSRVSSYERSHDSHHWDDRRFSRSPRSPRGDRSERSTRRGSIDSPPRRREPDTGRGTSTRRHRDSSWSSVEGFLRNSHHRIHPVPTDDGRSSLGVPSEDFRSSRSLSRVRTMPASSAQAAENFMESDPPRVCRSSATFPVVRNEEVGDQKKTQLPYPDDDEDQDAWFEGVSASGVPRQLQPGASSTSSMPHIPPVIDELTAISDQDFTAASSPVYLAPPTTCNWQPPSLDPEQEKSRAERPVGAYRRYSDAVTRGDGQEQRLPECSRTTPVAGLMDWITLPRTDFNICPDCYGEVFASTQYRTQFQPLLRPTMDPIACDFGSSPWYRIAWLLTLKEQKTDLQLFFKAAKVLASTRDRPCPGSQKALDFWYVVKDPFTRRAVPDFTVCHECTEMVEALFPVLRDVFGPQDAWQEPARSVCSLHFLPDREEFPLYFDAFEVAAETAFTHDRSPDIGDLCMTLNRIGTFSECRESRRVSDGYWYLLTFLPEFTVCGECYDDVVRPQQLLDDDNDHISGHFLPKPQKLAVATCQLYSPRMRDVFKWACRRDDAEYLKARVKERKMVEDDLHAKFVNLVRDGRRNRWTEEQIDKLAREWRKWE